MSVSWEIELASKQSMFLVLSSGSRGDLQSIRRISISDLNANVKMLAFTDGTCAYII